MKIKVTKVMLLPMLLVTSISGNDPFGLSEPTRVAAETISQVNQGDKVEFPLIQVLGKANLKAHAKDCTPSAFNISITSVDSGEAVFEKYQEFSLEHCISSTERWKGLFTWDTKKCESICVTIGDIETYVSGAYTFDFVLTVGKNSDEYLTNSFEFDLVPAQFYSVSLDTSIVYPYSDDYKDDIGGFVTYWNSDGEEIPTPKSKLGFYVNGKKISEGKIRSNGTFSLKLQSKLIGSGVLKMTEIEKGVGGKKWVDLSNDTKVKMYPTVVVDASLSVTPKIYPSKDGFLDAGYIGITTSTNSQNQIPITGEVTISRSGKVVKTYKMSHSNYSQFTWDGKVAGRVVAGIYQVSANVKGPQGNSVIANTSISVGEEKWQYRTISKTYGAYIAADSSQGNSYYPIQSYGVQGIRLYSSGDGDTMVVKFSLPINAQASKWRIRVNDWQTGDGYFVYLPCTSSDCLTSYDSSAAKGFDKYESGSGTWTDWSYIPGSVANFSIGCLDWASMYIDSFTIEYVTKTFE